MSTSPMPGSAPASEAPQAKISAMGRVFGALFSPGETFADIARAPSWIAPIVLLSLLGLGVGYTLNQRADWRGVAEKQASQSPRWEQLTAEQKKQQLDISEKVSPYFAYGIGVCFPVLAALVLGSIYLGSFNLFLSARINFKTAFSIGAHAWMPHALSAPMAIVVVMMKAKGEVDPQNLLATHLGAFVSNDAPKWLSSLAGSLDLFSFWVMTLLAIGFAAANPKKISKGAAFGVVFGVWAVYVLAKVGWNVIRG